ncbi:MAG: hypothetical protein Fur0021_34680 [Candidatus Promineifilaceae bacterium]
MNDMAKSVLRFIGYLFGILVLGFTGYQTWSLLYTVSNSTIVATLGLVLFEGSMLYWWFFFQREAEGLLQMGLSLLVAVFGLLLVGGATALHLGAVDADVLGQQTPARLVTLAAVVNLVAKFLMPLLHPDVMKTTYKKALTGKVMTQTFSQFETKVKEIAVQLAEEVAEDWKEDVRQEILSLHMSRPKVALPAPTQTRGERRLEVANRTNGTGPIKPDAPHPNHASAVYPVPETETANETAHPPNPCDRLPATGSGSGGEWLLAWTH